MFYCALKSGWVDYKQDRFEGKDLYGSELPWGRRRLPVRIRKTAAPPILQYVLQGQTTLGKNLRIPDRLRGNSDPPILYIGEACRMRTTIVLDEKLVGEAMQLAGIKTRREMVDRALREYVARHRQRKILQLANQGLIAADYDIRTMRKGLKNSPR